MVAAANPLESFIWGAGGAKKTPEQVAREREIAAALMKGGVDYSPVDHWMQGAARAAQAGVGAFKDWRADNAEETGRSAFQSQWDSVFGGAPTQTASIDPVAQALTATDAVNSAAGGSDFLSSLISNESGGDWAAQNDAVGSGGQVGHFGRLQFGQARLQDAMNAGVIPAGTTPEQFMADPAAQQAVEAWHFADIDKQAADLGLNKYIGQTIGGAQITPEAIRAMAHLGGIGGAQKFLESGGQYNPSDANGTSLLDYAQNHGGAGDGTTQVAQALTGGQPNMQQLMGLASDPWASDSQKSIINSLLGQQMEQQAQANDPLRQLQIEAAQKALDTPTEQWAKLDDNTLYNQATGETKPLGAAGGPTSFEGTGLDAQAWNILQSAAPDSREYATAYSIIAQPKPQMVQTENGMMLVPVAPQLPAWLVPPGSAATPVASPASPMAPAPQAPLIPQGQSQANPAIFGGAPATPPGPAAAPAALPAATQPSMAGAGQLIPGTQKPSTEQQQRNEMLGTVLTSDLPTINANFDALADPQGQLLSMIPGGLGNPWQSPEYQQAANAVSSSVANILYSVSGASANPGETANQIRNLTPAWGDKPATIADKKRRLNTFVNAVASASGNPELIAQARAESLRGMDEPASAADDPSASVDIDRLLQKYGTP